MIKLQLHFKALLANNTLLDACGGGCRTYFSLLHTLKKSKHAAVQTPDCELKCFASVAVSLSSLLLPTSAEAKFTDLVAYYLLQIDCVKRVYKSV